VLNRFQTLGLNIVEDQRWIIVDEPGDSTQAVAAARALIERERR